MHRRSAIYGYGFKTILYSCVFYPLFFSWLVSGGGIQCGDFGKDRKQGLSERTSVPDIRLRNDGCHSHTYTGQGQYAAAVFWRSHVCNAYRACRRLHTAEAFFNEMVGLHERAL